MVGEKGDFPFRASQLLAYFDLLGNVGLDADPATQFPARTEQRTRIRVEPPLPAVLAAHQDLKADAAPRIERFADAGHRAGIGALEIQQRAGFLPDGLLGGIAGQARETFIHPHQPTLRTVDRD